MKTKEFTGREIYDAIEKNGLEELRGDWLNVDYKGNITAGCILTQGAWNLNVVPAEEDKIFNLKIYHDKEIDEDALNTEFTLSRQLNLVPPLSVKYSKNPEYPNEVFSGVSEAITTWYDHHTYKTVTLNDGFGDYEEEVEEYTLPTYQDALEMAKELLEPYFDRKFTLAILDSFVLESSTFENA
jgi:hypothetical protein